MQIITTKRVPIKLQASDIDARILQESRNEASRRLDLDCEQQKMKNIIHGLRSKHDPDEAPGAYKNIEDVMALQQDLVMIVTQLWLLEVIKG